MGNHEDTKPAKDDSSKKGRNGSGRVFDLDDPKLPKWVEEGAFSSGGYPHAEPLDDDDFDKPLVRLQIELVKLQQWAIAKGERILILFEGRDAAGKGSAIGAIRQYMSPRRTRVIALDKPSEVERGQWYFQRYVPHLPSAGDAVLFDRSWYNRAGVERVMNFCTPAQTELFLKEVPRFEDMLVDERVRMVKFYLEIGREMQLKRFHERRHDPLKVWKISPIDHAAIDRYDDYTAARDRMLEVTHRDAAPWTIVLGNDKKRMKLNALRHLLGLFDYPGKDRKAIGEIDDKVLGYGPGFLTRRE